jgi:hypothetical protein
VLPHNGDTGFILIWFLEMQKSTSQNVVCWRPALGCFAGQESSARSVLPHNGNLAFGNAKK